MARPAPLGRYHVRIDNINYNPFALGAVLFLFSLSSREPIVSISNCVIMPFSHQSAQKEREYSHRPQSTQLVTITIGTLHMMLVHFRVKDRYLGSFFSSERGSCVGRGWGGGGGTEPGRVGRACAAVAVDAGASLTSVECEGPDDRPGGDDGGD